MNSIFTRALNSARKHLPAELVPGTQYAKSYAAAMCLLVSADFEFEVEEFNQAATFMEKDPVLDREKLIPQATQYFREYTEAIKDVMCASSLDFPTIQSEMISEVREVPDAYRQDLKNMLDTIRRVSGDLERKIIDRINL